MGQRDRGIPRAAPGIPSAVVRPDRNFGVVCGRLLWRLWAAA
jgi:hypothetical protein